LGFNYERQAGAVQFIKKTSYRANDQALIYWLGAKTTVFFNVYRPADTPSTSWRRSGQGVLATAVPGAEVKDV